jgi:hypothetical protein
LAQVGTRYGNFAGNSCGGFGTPVATFSRMRSWRLGSFLIWLGAAAIAAPACTSTAVDGSPIEQGGEGGEGAAGRNTAGSGPQGAGGAGEAGGGAGEASASGLKLDADGCPLGSWQEADGLACEPPEARCALFDDCGSSEPEEALACIAGSWSYTSNQSDCGEVELGADGCPIDYRDADDFPCSVPNARCPLSGCAVPLLLCLQGEWQYNYHESDCGYPDDGQGGSGGEGGTASGSGGEGGTASGSGGEGGGTPGDP